MYQEWLYENKTLQSERWAVILLHTMRYQHIYTCHPIIASAYGMS